jgi:hypothetical protein
MTKSEVMDLTTISHNFPTLPDPEIQRENYLDTIETMFDGVTELVVVEGDEGIGKTTLLAKFALRYPNNAISLFVRPTNRWAYDPEMLSLNLANQLQWLLTGSEIDPTEGVDEGVFRRLLFELCRRSRRQSFYFVLDGLQESQDLANHLQEVILDSLPIGTKGIRFLMSGDFSKLPDNIRQRIGCRSFRLSVLSLDDTDKFLKAIGQNVDLRDVEEIHKICHGIPGRLAVVKRILDSSNVKTLLDEMPDKLSDLFGIEWRVVDTNNEQLRLLLGIMAHDRKRHSIDDLAHLVGISSTDVKSQLEHLSFIVISPDTCEVEFASESFRKYAAEQLRDIKRQVNELIVDFLLKQPDSEMALSDLPLYLQQTGRLQNLIEYLSPEKFTRMVECSQSLLPVQRQAHMGVVAARDLQRPPDLMRFSLQESLINELNGAEVLRSEIEARIALNDYESAMSLAQSSMLKEDRLHLLAVIGKTRVEKGQQPEPELKEQINQLYAQIDCAVLGERSVDIASDLLYVLPEIAIEMVEKSTTGTDAAKGKLDWAFAKLSLEAADSGQDELNLAETIDMMRSKIKDPVVQQFSAKASLMLKDYSANQIIEEVQKLGDAGDQLFLLRRWTMKNRENTDAVAVVEFAVKLAIRATEQTVTAREMRELAAPLPYIVDQTRAKQLVGSFDSQKGSIAHLSTTVDLIRLQLILAQTESKYDFEAARNRIIDVYLSIMTVEDLVIRAECLARLFAALHEIDPSKTFEIKDGLHSLVEDDLKASVTHALQATAEHQHAVRGVVRALAKTNPDLALTFTSSLNVAARRDGSLLELIESAIEVPIEHLDLNFFQTALSRFFDQNVADDAIVAFLNRCSTETKKPETAVALIIPLIERILEIQDTAQKCSSICAVHNLLVKNGGAAYSGLCERLLKDLNKAWQAIDVGWVKIDTGYEIINLLAETTMPTAQSYLESTESLRKDSHIDIEKSALAYIACVRLAVRAFGGLLYRDIDVSDEFSVLAQLIDRIPANGERAGVWSEVALRCQIANRTDYCKRIVSEHVKPLVSSISTDDAGYRSQVIVAVAPALYSAHKSSALEMISSLPDSVRDDGYKAVCDFILRKRPSYDPYEFISGKGYNVSYDDILDLLELLGRVKFDGYIYVTTDCIVDSISSRQGRQRFSVQQSTEISRRLLQIVENNLPDKSNICHDGYKIAAKAKIAQIRQTKPQEWLDLISAADSIPNQADRSFVLGIVAEAMPNKQIEKRKETFERAREIVRKIPAVLDRIERYYSLASMAAEFNRGFARECLEFAMKDAVIGNDPELYPIQQHIIDLAYRLDEDGSIASSLASMADDDPARLMARTRLNHRIDILAEKKRIANQSDRDTAEPEFTERPRVAWMLLGALNAGRITTTPIDYRLDDIQESAKLPLNKAYPILSWIIENANQRYAYTDQVSTVIRPIYEAMLLGTELAASIVSCSGTGGRLNLMKLHRGVADVSNHTISPGERERAIQILTDWFEHDVHGYLKICDEYFGLDDLEVLQLLNAVNPECKVYILTSRKQQAQQGIEASLEEAYRSHWRTNISSDQDPPDTEIVVVGARSSGKSPIHDRWWLTEDSGIRIGTSFNSLGVTQISEISWLSADEANQKEEIVDQYLQREMRVSDDGERLSYALFTL